MDLVVKLAQSSHRPAGPVSGVAARRGTPDEAGDLRIFREWVRYACARKLRLGRIVLWPRQRRVQRKRRQQKGRSQGKRRLQRRRMTDLTRSWLFTRSWLLRFPASSEKAMRILILR